VVILKGVKVTCFDALLEVFIPKELGRFRYCHIRCFGRSAALDFGRHGQEQCGKADFQGPNGEGCSKNKERQLDAGAVGKIHLLLLCILDEWLAFVQK
jgi:hypothetical protein